MDIELKLCAFLSRLRKILTEHVDDWLELLHICHLLVEGFDPIVFALELYLLLMVLVGLLLQASDSLS